MTHKAKHIETLCRAVWEMNKQAPHDFGGEQREFYLPKLGEVMVVVGSLFPVQFAAVVIADEEMEA